MQGVPPSGGGFSPGQSQVSNQDKEKVCFLLLLNSLQHSENSKQISKLHSELSCFCKSSPSLVLETETVFILRSARDCLTYNGRVSMTRAQRSILVSPVESIGEDGTRWLKSPSAL